MGKDEELDEDEKNDIAAPLPEISSSSGTSTQTQQTKPRQRRRSMSAPQGYLFTEPPQVLIRKKVQPKEFEDLPRFGDESGSECTDEGPAQKARSYKRVRQISCPTHYLQYEARKQVDSNYFFG